MPQFLVVGTDGRDQPGSAASLEAGRLGLARSRSGHCPILEAMKRHGFHETVRPLDRETYLMMAYLKSLGGVGTRITIFDQDVAAGRPSELPEPLPEILKVTLRVRVVLGNPQQYRDPPHPGPWLLRARRERPSCRAADQRQEMATVRLIALHSVTANPRIWTISNRPRLVSG